MLKPSNANDILQSGGFWLHKTLHRLLGLGFVGQCLTVTIICAVGMILASIADQSLRLPGRNVGLLEHPAIWGFLILQTALPISLARSIGKLERTTVDNGEITCHEGKTSALIVPTVRRFLRLQDRESQLTATLIYCTGLVAWVWNTYQNQFPGIIVPYDFWDSTTYFWGYAVTRVYKLYIFVVLLPYLAMIHVGILLTTLRLVRRSRLAGELRLLPFHPDGLGGLGFVAGLVSKPIILTLIVGALTTAGAFFVHYAVNMTPLIGLLILVAWTVLAYIVPVLFLRTDIVALKRDMIQKLRSLQQADYSRVFEDSESGWEFRVLRKEKEALEYFDKMCARIQSISNYPHWKRLIGFAGLAATPSIVAFAAKFLVGLFPVMSRILGKL
jgi:hypothetical protein